MSYLSSNGDIACIVHSQVGPRATTIVLFLVICTLGSVTAQDGRQPRRVPIGIQHIQAGQCDRFRGCPERVAPSDALLLWFVNRRIQVPLNFDEVPGENGVPAHQGFAHTIKGLPPGIVGAELRITLRATTDATGAQANNDQLHLEFSGGEFVWRASIRDLPAIGYSAGQTKTIVLDLANLPAGFPGPTNILSGLADGELDIYVQDDTGVDCAELTVRTHEVMRRLLREMEKWR